MVVLRGMCGAGLAGALVASGCSYAFVMPSHRPASPAPDCTTTRLAPIGDTLGAITGGALVALGGAAIAGSEGGVSATSLGIYFGVTGLATTLLTISAVHGYRTTGACRNDQAAWEREQIAAAAAVPADAHATAHATVISSDSTRWDVLVDGRPTCVTPCSIAANATRVLSMRSQTPGSDSLSVSRLSGGAQVVTAQPPNSKLHTAAFVASVITGVGIATGIGIAVGAQLWHPTPGTGDSSFQGSLSSAGIGVAVASAAGLLLSIYVLGDARAHVQVTPAANGAGAALGLAGAF
jgi:hypothetical protein